MSSSRTLGALALIVTLALIAVQSGSTQTQAATDRFVSGEIIVQFQPGANANDRAAAHREAGGSVLAEIERTGVQLVSVTPGQEQSALARYTRNPNVVAASPNLLYSIPETLNHDGGEVVPGDFYFEDQWALNNTGQGFFCLPWINGELCIYIGTPDADIDAPEGWAVTTGSSVSVAVLDTGVDYTHPDIAPNYDGGYDFISNDSDPMDDMFHGTHVAGTIVGAMNNLSGDPAQPEGVSGVAPNARLLAYKVCDADGLCPDFAIEQGLARAIEDGAQVVNLSLGSTGLCTPMLDAAVQDAWSAGLIIVAAAGNNGDTQQVCPAAFDNVISVAAFDEDHLKASFSTYGNWVDIAAPGNAIVGPLPMFLCAGLPTTPGDEGCYDFVSGTSMAAPHVAGVAALLWSRPDVTTNSQVRDLLLDSADGAGVSPTRLDSWSIHGGLNMHDALSLAVPPTDPTPTPTPSPTPSPTATPGTEDSVIITKASYNRGKGQVKVEAISSDSPDATLTVYDNSNPAAPVEIGQLGYVSKRDLYSGVFDWPAQPGELLVQSSEGGEDSYVLRFN
jgi:thermitase